MKRTWSLLASLCLVAGMAGPVPGQDKLELSADEQQLVDLTNQARAKEKLAAVKPHPVLFKMARAHSANMARLEMLEHVLDGKKPEQRVVDLGYQPVSLKENIGKSGTINLPLSFERWQQVQGGKECIFNKPATDIGVGIAKDAKGNYYYTLVTSARAK